MNGGLRTIKWLLKDFSILSIFKVIFYYLKKKMNIINCKNFFILKFRFEGKKIKFKIRENKDDFAIVREVFLYGAYKLNLKDRFNKKEIFDIGAHLGASAVYFSCIFPNSKIYCFEPDKNSRKLLLENLGKNSVNASVFDLAVSDKRKKVYFNANIENPAFSGISNNKGEMINAISLEEILDFLKIEKVDLIKADIEGEEILMLKGLRKSKNKIKLFICETHYNKYDVNDLKNSFLEKGFEISKPLPHWSFLNPEIEFPIIIAKNKQK